MIFAIFARVCRVFFTIFCLDFLLYLRVSNKPAWTDPATCIETITGATPDPDKRPRSGYLLYLQSLNLTSHNTVRTTVLYSQLHCMHYGHFHASAKDNTRFVNYSNEWVSRVLRPTRHITGHFGDESFQAITCTGTDNTKQTAENTPKTQKNKLALGK